MWWVVSQSECSLAVPKRATLSAAVSECSTEVGRRGPVPCCGCERIDDCSRIVSEKVFGQRHVIRPIAGVVAGREEVRRYRVRSGLCVNHFTHQLQYHRFLILLTADEAVIEPAVDGRGNSTVRKLMPRWLAMTLLGSPAATSSNT